MESEKKNRERELKSVSPWNYRKSTSPRGPIAPCTTHGEFIPVSISRLPYSLRRWVSSSTWFKIRRCTTLTSIVLGPQGGQSCESKPSLIVSFFFFFLFRYGVHLENSLIRANKHRVPACAKSSVAHIARFPSIRLETSSQHDSLECNSHADTSSSMTLHERLDANLVSRSLRELDVKSASATCAPLSKLLTWKRGIRLHGEHVAVSYREVSARNVLES